MKGINQVLLAGALLAAPLGAVQAADAVRPGTLLELSSAARRVVEQDRVQITLAVEKQGKTAEEVQRAINTQMQAAKKIYEQVPGVKVSTGGYNVWQNEVISPLPVSGVNPKKTINWRGNQQVNLEAPSGETVLKLVADLQAAGLAVQGMNYYLSRDATDKLTDDLMVEALGTIQQRARKVGMALGLPNVAIEEVSSGDAGGGVAPMRMMAKAMMASDAMESMPAPVGKPGETEVSINVNAKVRLTK